MAKEFHTGSLKKTVVFKKNSRGSLGAGTGDVFETFLTTRCSLEKKRAVKVDDKKQVQIAQFYYLVCRFQTNLLTNLNGSCIAVIDSVKYVIHDFDLVDEKRHLYEFVVTKAVF